MLPLKQMRRAFLLILAPCLLAAAPATKPDAGDRPATLAELKTIEQSRAAGDYAGQPVLEVASMADVMKLSLENKDIQLRTPLKPVENAVVHVPQLPGIFHVRFLGSVEPGKPPIIVHFDFEVRDFTVPDAISRITNASYTEGKLMLSQMWDRVDDQTHTVQLLQTPVEDGSDESHVTLYVQRTDDPPIELTLKADNVVDLRRKYPGEVAKYVDPMFRALHQTALLERVDPRLAWQVFQDAFQPTTQLKEQVKSLVAKLDADQFQKREAASRELESIGESAALILMRQPRQGLSDEQLSRIDAFLAKYRMETDDRITALRHDRDFLIDCLSSDVSAIRVAALKQLRIVTGRPIEFDVNADLQTRQNAIDGLRSSIGTRAATTIKVR